MNSDPSPREYFTGTEPVTQETLVLVVSAAICDQARSKNFMKCVAIYFCKRV